MPDATPQTAAPAPAAEQPAAQAVPAPAQTALPLDQAQAAPAVDPAATAAPAPGATDPDELTTLRKRYADSSAEALRLYRENESLKYAKPAQAGPADPFQGYTKQNWEALKEQRLSEAFEAASTGNSQAAKEAAHQVTLIDAKLREVEYGTYANQQAQAKAFDQLKAQLAPVFEKHKDDLAPGTPLYTQIVNLKNQAVAAGRPDDEFTTATAVMAGLLISGKLTTSEAKAAQTATQNLNQAIKGAAAAGSGAANTNAAPTPNFTTMSTKEFADFRRGLGVGK